MWDSSKALFRCTIIKGNTYIRKENVHISACSFHNNRLKQKGKINPKQKEENKKKQGIDYEKILANIYLKINASKISKHLQNSVIQKHSIKNENYLNIHQGRYTDSK